MKRIILGLFAIGLATSFSAFTSTDLGFVKENQTGLFWYNYDPGTNQIVSQVGSSALTESQAQNLTGCESTSNIVCAFGYTAPQSGLPKTPPASSGDITRTAE